MKKKSRKTIILEVLARELETKPGNRITTASLAKAVGVSEAALYRHFASKAQIFEGLIEFAEETIFSNINVILEEEKHTQVRCGKIIYLVLRFADRNPGIIRILLGDILIGEQKRLRDRTSNFFERVEYTIKQVLKESSLRKDSNLRMKPDAGSDLITSFIEGRLHKYQRLNFIEPSLTNWDDDWAALSKGLFFL